MTDDSAVAGAVLIIGTGLMGTSAALALRRAGVTVLLEDANPQHAAMAVERGAGVSMRDGDEPVVVVVACPPRQAAQALADASARFPMATLTDVTSVKAPVLSGALLKGADPRRLVGGHPMAGRELSGPVGARGDLFDDRLWIVTPGSADVDHVMNVHRLVTACGGYVVEMDADDHDAAVALVSHVPQVLASALAAQLLEAKDAHVRIAGQGLRDMTRIAASNVEMWSDILEVNGAPVADVLDRLAVELEFAAAALRDGRAADVGKVLSAGVSGQLRIPGKHGATAERYAEVTVQLADRSGELARMFVAAAEAGVNVEDVRIEHVLGRPSGLVSLFVLPGRDQDLSEALRAREFDVRD